MVEPARQLERIVLEVLAEMGLVPPGATMPGATGTAGATGGLSAAGATGGLSTRASVPAAAADSDLAVDRRVVTLADLPERLDGVRRVVVPPGAVVTPSVRDVLQRRQLPLVFGTPAVPATRAGLRVILMTHGPKHDPAPLAQVLAGEGFAVESRRMDCLIAATDELAGELRAGGVLGVLLTRHAAAAVCLANRLAGVRAVRGATVDESVSDVEAVGANLLVIDPAAQGPFPTRQMALRFLRGGPRECPEVFRHRLA
jgi:hypothetical protein